MNAQQRGGERISARCATKHQIKKSDESDDEFCLLFLFSFFFLLKKFKKRRGGRRLGREGMASLVAHVLSFYEKRRIRVTRTKTHATYHKPNGAFGTLFVRSKRFYRCCCSSSSSSRNKRKIQKRTNF